MKVDSVTFSLGNTMPLQPLTRRSDDQYANLKPFASVTIAFEDGDAMQLTPENEKKVRALLEDAFSKAANVCFDQLATFRKEVRSIYAPKPNENK